MKHSHRNSTSNRGGFTMLELTVAATLLGTVFVVTLPLLKHVRVSRDAAQQQFIAQQEAANLMEQLAVNGSSDAADDAITISPEAASHLHDADVTITREPEHINLQRVTVAVSWTNDSGERPVPVKLTAWFPTTRETP